ncbi:hypothetical protein LCGC14_1865120 [marine sediment metagenome]|uniref:Uncharacterized protein n=1 Tax=marine sediment metagenome TaxID=412755 RepID=A0A0F9GUP6_9ZZZZ
MTFTLDSDGLDQRKVKRNRQNLQLLNQIIDILGQFENNYNKKFNFSKIGTVFKNSQL